MEEYITISSCRKSKVGVKTNSEDSLEFLMNSPLPHSQIPEYDPKIGEENSSWEISYREGGPELQLDSRTKEIEYRREFGMGAKWDITNIISGTLVSEMLKGDGLVTFHASAFSKERKGILIAGPPLAGKTTVLLYSLYEENSNFLSSEKTVLDGKYTIGGSDIISVDEGGIKRFLPEFNIELEEHIPENSSFNPEEKVLISPEKAEEKVSTDLIVFPKIVSGDYVEELKIEDNKKRFLLLDNLSRGLKNSTYLFDFQDSLPNLLEKEDRKKVLSEVKELEEIPAYFIEGDPKGIFSKVKELI